MWFSRRRGLLLFSTALAAGLLIFCTGQDPQPATSAAESDGSTSPVTPGTTTTTEDAGTLVNAVAITTGQSHTCALTSEGTVLCWGDNTKGQLGVPSSGLQSSSVPVRVPFAEKVLSVSAGKSHSCVVTDSHHVVCWGDGAKGQIGDGPADAGFTVVRNGDGGAPLERIDEVSAGASHTCARELQPAQPIGPAYPHFGAGHCWGSNASYALGQLAPYGPTPVRAGALPPLAPGVDDVPLIDFFFASSLATGTDFACARGGYLLPGGGVSAAGPVCWGANDKHQLGRDGGPFARPQVVIVPGQGALGSTDMIAVGQSHACAVIPSAPPALYCWGDNTQGQLSDAGAPNVPVPVSGIDASKIKALAAGGSVTCAIEDTTVRCVGASDQGQLGNDTVNTAANPTWSVVDAPRPSAIAVSGTHVCAVLGGAPGGAGPVACWGSNTNGQLGDGVDLAKGYPEAGRGYLRATPVRVQAPR